MIEQVTRLEAQAAEAFPALQEHSEGGWRVRWTKGYTRRANSVQPGPGRGAAAILPGGGGTLAAVVAGRIADCEAFYRGRGLPSVFRITPLTDPPWLDAHLGAAGYSREGESLVMERPLTDLAVLSAGLAPTLSAGVNPAWLEAFGRLDGTSSEKLALLGELLERVQGPQALARIEDGGPTVACGRAVCAGDGVGLFDIVTHPEQRGRGLGGALVLSLLHWAAAAGARRAWLQVEAANGPAQRLYHRLGFREAYRYAYRVQSD